MTNIAQTIESPNHDDRRLGQRWALAIASLALGVASFISLLGVEKALLAIAFGALALRPPAARPPRRVPAEARIAPAVVVVVIVKYDELARLVEYLQKSG